MERVVPVSELVTVDEIARKLRMSVNAAVHMVRGRDGRAKTPFPAPLVGKGDRGVWLWTEVEEWWTASAPRSLKQRRRAARVASQTFKHQSWSHGRRSA